MLKMIKCKKSNPTHKKMNMPYTLQVLWEHVQPSQNHSIYNGGVEAVSNLLSKQHQIKVSSAEYGSRMEKL